MGQVPKSSHLAPPILIVGRGKMATHFSEYLTLLEVRHTQWHRESKSSLLEISENSERVVLLISDDAIEGFIRANPFLKSKTLIHFSGALSLEGVHSFHPLMTFSEELYDLDEYQKMPFIGVKGKSTFQEVFPELPNHYWAIPEDKKALYHALCVLSGNATSLLWKRVTEAFEEEFHFPPHVTESFRDRIFKNIQSDFEKAPTGPIVRRDWNTIDRNLSALSGHPYQGVYQALVKAEEEVNSKLKEKK